MTDPHDEYGEILRRALNAEADSVTPSADGLDRIRSRVSDQKHRRFGWEWFTANWGRPVLAVGAAVAIAGLGVSAPQTMDLIQSVGSNGDSDHGGQNNAVGNTTQPNGGPGDPRSPQVPDPSATGPAAPPDASVPTPTAGTVSCTPNGSAARTAPTTAPKSPGADQPTVPACPAPSNPTTSQPTTPPPSTSEPVEPSEPAEPTDAPTSNPANEPAPASNP